MDGAELQLHIIFGSLMDNGKMEFHMDTLEKFGILVSVFIKNIKMAKKLEEFEINLEL